jgi:hypothetical protein
VERYLFEHLSIPKGLNHSARRCEERATPGQHPKQIINPEGVVSFCQVIDPALSETSAKVRKVVGWASSLSDFFGKMRLF